MPNLNDSMDDEYHMITPLTNRNTMPNPSISTANHLDIQAQQHQIQQDLVNQQILQPQIVNNLNINGMYNVPTINQQPQINSLNSINNNSMTMSFQGNQNLKNSFAQPVTMHPVPVFNSQYSNVLVPSPYNYYGY